MKPFDLQKALAGKPVITRIGKPVVFGAYNQDAVEYDVIVGWVDGEPKSWSKEGRYLPIDGVSGHDLFMASIKRTGWVNIYPNGRINDSIRKTKEESLKYSGIDVVATIQIEWEE